MPDVSLFEALKQVHQSSSYGANRLTPQGPANWHRLVSKANVLCGQGRYQSSINIVSRNFDLIPASELRIDIPNFEKGAEFGNLSITVEVVTEGLGGRLTFNGTDYSPKQFHFHLPSEHLDTGTSIAIKMHMVWAKQEEKEKIVVIGVSIDLDDRSLTT